MPSRQARPAFVHAAAHTRTGVFVHEACVGMAKSRLTVPVPARRVGRARVCMVAATGQFGKEYVCVMLVPTGVNASVGGFAGDALPSARTLAAVADILITHPNVMNGAMMYWPIPNALYVEGFSLDRFAAGECALQPVRGPVNRIGLVLDSGMDDDMALRHLQVLDAAKATLGLSIVAVKKTRVPLDVHLEISESNTSWGTLQQPAALLEAAAALCAEPYRCDAIAIVARFPDDEEDEEMLQAYRQGEGVDAIGGAEAVISHLVSRDLRVPCAHAPALPPLDVDDSVSPKAAAEELGYTFLPCVLAGLSRAPRMVSRTSGSGTREAQCIVAEDVDALVLPVMACGGAAALSFASNPNTLLVLVEENASSLSISAEDVQFPSDRTVVVRNYFEAAGVVAAHKAGVALDSVVELKPSPINVIS
ncbi:putative lipoprotein [Porphyridium purpureum]|uniref:Putative lipoprotein n=1 Tax=Porphyridium purpureum TaxID=35688 RepID=A0A5J4YWI0_PORPP|nr:putative lipoprotein [Porphyridium purpureum]|eukprot:POR1759..scf209_3